MSTRQWDHLTFQLQRRMRHKGSEVIREGYAATGIFVKLPFVNYLSIWRLDDLDSISRFLRLFISEREMNSSVRCSVSDVIYLLLNL